MEMRFFPPHNEISTVTGDFLAHQDLLYILTFFTMPLSVHLAMDHGGNLYQDVNEMVGGQSDVISQLSDYLKW